MIDGQRIHFLHVRSPESGALPLILTHGWPGSVVEFLDVIGPLTDPAGHGADPGDAFNVVIPTLPGFGFSGPVCGPGWTTTRIASAWDELMARLGYGRYGTQGGDIGAAVAPEVARVAPGHVVGVHTNGGPGGFPQVPLPDHVMASLSPIERDRIARVEAAASAADVGYAQSEAWGAPKTNSGIPTAGDRIRPRCRHPAISRG